MHKQLCYVLITDDNNIDLKLEINKHLRYNGLFHLVNTLSCHDDTTYVPIQAGLFPRPSLINTLDMIREIEQTLKQSEPMAIWLFVMGPFDKTMCKALATLLSRVTETQSSLNIISQSILCCKHFTHDASMHDELLEKTNTLNVITSIDTLHKLVLKTIHPLTRTTFKQHVDVKFYT